MAKEENQGVSMKTKIKDIEFAPKDGSTIIGIYDEGEFLIFWSDRPVCMLGPINGGFPAGWATAHESDTDSNLPMDEPDQWREYEN